MLPAAEPDDSAEVTRYARQILQEAGVGDRLPTPVADIVACAQLAVSQEIILSERHEDFFASSYGVLKSALKKILGLVDLRDKVIYLNMDMPAQRQTFVKFHEVGHEVLPWQRSVYKYLDDETTLNPDVHNLFERQANLFAADVMFQVGRFERDAADLATSLRSPIALAKRYGASAHASIRRYVEKSKRACALVVAELIPMITPQGSYLRVKQVVQSPSFAQRFHNVTWASQVGCDLPYIEPLFRNVRLIENHEIDLPDRTGRNVGCHVEVFSNTYSAFIFIFPVDEQVRSRTRIEIVQ